MGMTTKEKIEAILLRSQTDPSHVTYWDGVVPEIMDLIQAEREAGLALFNALHCKNCQKKAKKILQELNDKE